MKTFVLNKAQRKLHEIIKDLWDRNQIIRIFIMKARQLGCSTYTEALIYAITSQLENQNATIIADDVKGSNYIFEMSKLFHEKCPPHLKPKIKRSNEKKLEFDKTHSQILIDTAENKEAGRKFTFRVVHLSEYSFFRNPSHLMLGLSQAVPSMPRTILIKETTANGFNFAKDEWDLAVAGENDYVPIFIPWYWGEEYQMSCDHFLVGDSTQGEIGKEEPELYAQMEAEGIDFIEERLNWRRWCVRNNCEGKVDNFKQEYPSTPEEAFIASGECYFDKKRLASQLKTVREPLLKANIFQENYKYKLREDSNGAFSIYKKVEPCGQYVIGGDASSGSGLDWSVLTVLDKYSNEVVAIFRAKVDPDELAFRAMQVGNYYNNAKVAIENDKFGFAANAKLKTIYNNIYYQRTFNKVQNKMVEAFGWNTTSVSRPMMLSQLQAEIREDSAILNDPILIRECLTFIKNPETKKAQAQEGMNDDAVISRAIAGQLRHEVPYKFKEKKKLGREISQLPRNAGISFRKRT